MREQISYWEIVKKNLFKSRARLNVRKYSFCHRVVDIWNSLLDNVINAETIFSFEKRLDIYWKNQNVFYDYDAELDLRKKN